MWIKKNNMLINLNDYSGVRVGKHQHNYIELCQKLNSSDFRVLEIPLALYKDEATATEVFNEICEAMQNGDNVYTMPAGKEEI